MAINHPAVRAELVQLRTRVTHLLALLDADTVETTPETQAWTALADAHTNLSSALAFVDVDDPARAGATRGHLSAVR